MTLTRKTGASTNLRYQLLSFLFLPVITLFHHFIKDTTRTIRVTHIDISPGQIQFGTHLVATA